MSHPNQLPEACPKCGAPWGEGVFCDHCGHLLVMRRYCHTCRHSYESPQGEPRWVRSEAGGLRFKYPVHDLVRDACNVTHKYCADSNPDGRCKHWQKEADESPAIEPRRSPGLIVPFVSAALCFVGGLLAAWMLGA